MKTYGEGGRVEVWVHSFFTLVIDGSEWSASRPGRLTLRERSPGTHAVVG